MPTLSSVAELIMGQSPPSDTYNDRGDGLPFYQGKTDFGFKYPIPRLYCSSPKKVAEAGDILISVRAPVGPTNIASEKSCIGRGLGAIRAQTIDSEFLYFNLKYIEPHVASLGTGSTFTAINKTQLATLEVNQCGFDIPEQRRIAYVLSTVQTAIEQQARMIALTRELKSALMKKLFTEGIPRPHGSRRPVRSMVETEIGLIPEGWNVVKLGDIADLRKEIANPTSSTEEVYIGLEHIESSRFWWSGHGHPSEVRSAKNTFYPGDILYGKLRPYLDKAVISTSKGICSTDILALSPKENISSEFLVTILHSAELLAYSIKTTSGVNHPRTSWNSLREFQFGLPPKDERDELAEIMITLETKMLNAEKKCALLEELFRTLLHQLMTGQIRTNGIDITGLGDL